MTKERIKSTVHPEHRLDEQSWRAQYGVSSMWTKPVVLFQHNHFDPQPQQKTLFTRILKTIERFS